MRLTALQNGYGYGDGDGYGDGNGYGDGDGDGDGDDDGDVTFICSGPDVADIMTFYATIAI